MLKREITINEFMNNNPVNFEISVNKAEKFENGFTEYLIELKILSLNHQIFKRYTEFHDFDTTLKTTFPRVELPPFPSKFSIYNKANQRKKAFHNYLQAILRMCNAFPEIPRAILLNLLAEFIGIVGAEKHVEEPKPKVSKLKVVDAAQISAEKGIIRSYVEIKFREEEDWISYYGSLFTHGLFLFPNRKDSYFVTSICMVRAEINDGEEANVIEIHHKHELEPILLRTPEKENWRKELVILSSANLDSPVITTMKAPLGRLMVTVYSAQNLRLVKPAVSQVKPHVFVRLTLDQFEFQTSILECDGLVNWNQNFIIPIMNRFFILKIEVCAFWSEGWVKQSAKEEVLAEIQIPLTDVNQYPYTEGPLTLYLNLKDKKKKLVANRDLVPWLNVDIREQSSISAISQAPPSGYMEENELPTEASLKELKVISKRLKRVQILYSNFFEALYTVFTWTYPRFSAACLAVYCLLVLFLPFKYFPILLLFFLLLLFVFMHPKNKKLCELIKNSFFASRFRMKPIPMVKTIKQSTNEMKSQIEVVQQKVSERMLDKWKKFKEDAIELQLILLDITSYAEKIRQLFLWEDPKRTLYACIGLLVAMYVLLILPFKLVVLMAGIHRFYKGYKKTVRRIENNKRVTNKALYNMLNQYLKVRVMSPDSTESWPEDLRNNLSLQKKCVDVIRTSLGLDVTTEMFTLHKSPFELWAYLSSCSHMLKLKDLKGNPVPDLHEKQSKDLLKDYIKNIPSEYYRFQYPRLTNFEAYS